MQSNYEKILLMIRDQRSKQRELNQISNRLEDVTLFVKNQLRLIFDEVKDFYYNLNISTSKSNFVTREHILNDLGYFEILLGSKNVRVGYSITNNKNDLAIEFIKDTDDVICVEVSLEKSKSIDFSLNLDKQRTLVIPNDNFKISFQLISENSFDLFHNLIHSFYYNFDRMYGLDYFISDQFIQMYENQEQNINTLNSLSDHNFSQLAENILFKDIIPKLTYEIELFVQKAIRFSIDVYVNRIDVQFQNYPTLKQLLIKRVERYFIDPVKIVIEVIQVLNENAYKTSMTDPMYTYKVNYVTKILKDSKVNDEDSLSHNSEFLKIVCKDVDIQLLKSTYRNNKKVYKNAVRIWAYLFSVYPALKDNIVKTVQSQLIQIPIENLKSELLNVFDEVDETDMDKVMKPHPFLARYKVELDQSIDNCVKGLNDIRDLPVMFPHLVNDFYFLKAGEFMMNNID
jgi:hypothetical protein